MSAPVLDVLGVSKRYPGPVEALRGVDLRVEAGESMALVGPSGSGKSTLLHIMGTLERPTDGELRIAGHRVAGLGDRELAGLRARSIGFVFQQFFLLEGMTAVENVAQGLVYSGIAAAERRRRARRQLELVGLADRHAHRPPELSGGERQRVAIARALVSGPAIVFADEPTGNLDSAAGGQILDLLRELYTTGTTVVVVTHDHDVAARMDRRVEIRDGRIARDSART
jgi:putative ABC transport system ATP-binding protein